MNKKKVLAIVLAIILLIMGFMASGLKAMLINDIEKSDLKSLLLSTNESTEKVLEIGDSFNRIASISYYGVITSNSSYDKFMNNLEQIRYDDSIKAVILEVNSPGGGVYESEEIKNKILQIKEETGIPFYTSMGSIAASGGYYISAPTDKIYAANETITGSIGVIMSGLNLSGLFEKYGIGYDVIKSADLKDIGSSYRPMTEKDREVLQELIDLSYDRFITTVADGRGMDENIVRKIADGRIYDGSQALKNGLIDEIGYYDDALDDLKTEIGVENPEVFTYTYLDDEFSSFFSFKTNLRNIGKTDLEKNMEILENLQNQSSMRPMYLYGGI